MAARDEVIREIELRLGGQMVDVELDPEHYNLSVDKALEKFRQRSENAVEEAFVELNFIVDTNTYTLPNEIIEVRDIYRRGTGTLGQGSNTIEPFEAQYMNSYLLNSGKSGGLVTFDALAQHRETLGRLFGQEITFTWNHVTHLLTIHRRPKVEEPVFLYAYMFRPEESLFADIYASPWLKEYALAQSKLMLAEARGKFAQIAGPQGGTTLNADSLRQDALDAIEKLEDDIMLHREGSTGYGFTIG